MPSLPTPRSILFVRIGQLLLLDKLLVILVVTVVGISVLLSSDFSGLSGFGSLAFATTFSFGSGRRLGFGSSLFVGAAFVDATNRGSAIACELGLFDLPPAGLGGFGVFQTAVGSNEISIELEHC